VQAAEPADQAQKGFSHSLEQVRVDTGLASLCAYRLLTWHYPLPSPLSVWVAPLTGATPFLLAQERCAKEGHPDIRVSLRETSLAPVLLRVPAYMGHPWPIKRGRHRYLAASMRLAPLRNTSTRPPEGDQVASLRNLCGIGIGGVWSLPLLFICDGTDDVQIPFRRPSGITVEGVERHGCRESGDGPGMALRSVPLER